jgi:hypothetical protein
LDEELKRRVELVAAAEDRSVSEYVIRSLKERLDVQCLACGRSSGASVLPVALTAPFQNWLGELRKTRNFESFFVTTLEGAHRTVFFGQLNHSVEPLGALPMHLLLGDVGERRHVPVSIPFGVITGWGWDGADGRAARQLWAIGYLDGNEQARRIAASDGVSSGRR